MKILLFAGNTYEKLSGSLIMSNFFMFHIFDDDEKYICGLRYNGTFSNHHQFKFQDLIMTRMWNPI